MIQLSKPDIGELEREEVLKVLDSGIIALGPKYQEFEKLFREFAGAEHALAVCSGTCGLHLAVRAAGIKQGDHVITSPFSFVTSANVMLYEKAVPIFVDIDSQTLNISPEKIKAKIQSEYDWKNKLLIHKKTGAHLSALLPVHIFGQVCDMDGIMEIACEYNLPVIEDACEALGAEYFSRKKNKWLNSGTVGEVGVFAFYPNKQITTGEGGMIITDREDYAEAIDSMRNQGRSKDGVWLTHERLGYNYRMDELSAAIGIAQMKRIKNILIKRQEVAERYKQMLSGIDEVEFPYTASYSRISWFVYVIKIKNGINRNAMMDGLIKDGIQVRPYFTPIHLQPFYREMFGYKEGLFPVAEKISDRTIAIPFHTTLSEKEQKIIVNSLKQQIQKHKSHNHIAV